MAATKHMKSSAQQVGLTMLQPWIGASCMSLAQVVVPIAAGFSFGQSDGAFFFGLSNE